MKVLPKCDSYYGAAAQLLAAERRARQRKLIKHPELRKLVVERIKNGWTPEQISNRMIYERAPLRFCQETIYRYAHSKEGRRDDLCWYLPTHRVARRRRRARRRRDPKFPWNVSILFRPDDVAHRRQFGHWEAGLMLFKQKLGQSNVTFLVERVSRFTVILKNPNKRTKPVMGKIMDAIRDSLLQLGNPLPLIAAPSLSAGHICRLSLALRLGSAIPPHTGRKELSKTPIAVFADGHRENATSDR